jgi:sec-independent protein translocase protein TatC
MSTNALPAGAADQGRMTLIEHLIELRRRIIVCAVAIGLFAVVGWFLYPWISDFLLRPYRDIAHRSIAGGNLIATSPVEGFAVRMKITLYVAVAFAMPVILWQIWRFVAPGLYKHERRYAWPFVVSAITLFVSGAMLAYWTLPKALDWLSAVGGDNITQAYTADKYYQLIAYMMLAFGICFEFPIVLVFLQMAGIVSNEWLRKYRRHAIVVIFVVVAVATPSNDPISLLALSLPLVVFYEVAIVVGRVRNRRKRRAADAAAS